MAVFAFVMLLICLIVLAATNASGGQVSTRLVQAVRMVESHNGKTGDSGRARSHWQLHRGAWEDVNRQRRRQRLKVYTWQSGTRNEYVSKVYARSYLQLLSDRISQGLKRPAKPREIYAAYNWGITRFSRVGFNWNHVPRVVRERAQRVENLCQDSE